MKYLLEVLLFIALFFFTFRLISLIIKAIKNRALTKKVKNILKMVAEAVAKEKPMLFTTCDFSKHPDARTAIINSLLDKYEPQNMEKEEINWILVSINDSNIFIPITRAVNSFLECRGGYAFLGSTTTCNDTLEKFFNAAFIPKTFKRKEERK